MIKDSITVKDVLVNMTEEQKNVLYKLIGMRMSEIQDGFIVYRPVRHRLIEYADLAVYDSMTDLQKAVVEYLVNIVDKGSEE